MRRRRGSEDSARQTDSKVKKALKQSKLDRSYPRVSGGVGRGRRREKEVGGARLSPEAELRKLAPGNNMFSAEQKFCGGCWWAVGVGTTTVPS